MARTVRKEEYAARRNQILDAAQRLIYTRGYEQMTIQDILDDVPLSKGAFYHYFGSKQALLEALIARMLDQAEAFLVPIVEDPHLPALAKFETFFGAVAAWKTGQKDFILALLRGWYTDDNALVRQKVNALGMGRMAPFLTAIIRQGVAEGVMATAYTPQVGEVVLCLLQGMGDALAQLVLAAEQTPGAWERIRATVAAYTDALERTLGTAPNSLHLFDLDILREWFMVP
jgi:AcrR family transcriptional regulator